MSKLHQIHLQDIKTGKSEFFAQKDVINSEDMKKFIKETLKEQGAPPAGKQWMVCNESSEHFLWAKGESC